MKLANQRDSKLESERKESAAALAHAQVNYEELKKKHEPVEQQIRQLLEEKKVSDEAARARDARLVAAEAELEAVRSQLMQETQTTSAERLKTTEALASLESANRGVFVGGSLYLSTTLFPLFAYHSFCHSLIPHYHTLSSFRPSTLVYKSLPCPHVANSYLASSFLYFPILFSSI